MLIKIIISCFFIYYITLSTFAADGSIEANNNSETLLPLGYLPFTPKLRQTKSLPEAVIYIIANDLYYNGQSKLIPLEGEDPTSVKKLNDKLAFAYITGYYQYKENKISLKCFIKDTKTKKTIWSKSLTTSSYNLRKNIHKISDAIVQTLFGDKGFAQSKIAFTSKQSGFKEIYILDYDGKNPQKITNNQSINLIPTWGKNNDFIIYTSYQQQRPQLFSYQISLEKHTIYRTSKYLNLSPDYNPLDNELIYTSSIRGNSEIFRSYWNSRKQTRLTFSRSIETSPSWSPNGYEIVFTSNRAGSPQIYTMDRDGSNIKRLSYENSYNTSPSWSPSGDLIVFVGMSSSQELNIYTIQTNGKDLKQLTNNSGKNENPTWSPNGKSIIFSSNRFDQNELFIMKANGEGQKRIYQKHGIAPSWSH